MAGLDDASMHRPDRDLMQRFAFDGEEVVGGALLRRRIACAERILHIPKAEIEPRPAIGRTGGLISVETLDGALQSDRRRVKRADRGNFLSKQARLTTRISLAAASASAMWTSGAGSASPQRPRGVARPAATSRAARRHSSGVTTNRGHGRWPSTRLPSMLSASDGIALPQLSRYVLEPGDQRWRQIDAGAEHQREMREHRHVGRVGLRGSCRSGRAARRRRCC
jgi:hypothetical protein